MGGLSSYSDQAGAWGGLSSYSDQAGAWGGSAHIVTRQVHGGAQLI